MRCRGGRILLGDRSHHSSGTERHMNYSPYENVPTFSQRHGLREVPGPPQLEEISPQARNNLWGALWKQLRRTADDFGFSAELGGPWLRVFADVHQWWLGQPLDQYESDLEYWQHQCRTLFLESPYDVCLDFLETLARHPACPGEFIKEIEEIFHYQLAYRIDTTSIPTIIPAATKYEGDALARALEDLEGAGLGGAAKHLRQAGQLVIGQDWPGSVRESIHAVESVAKRVAPGDADTLGKALAALGRRRGLHGALKRGFGALYGYTSDEDGVRHASMEDESKVTQDEAVYMIGACAAFCSYLWRKFGSQDASSTDPN